MIIKRMTYYFQGKLSMKEAMELWVQLIKNPDQLALLKTYGMYRTLSKIKMNQD